MRMLFSWVVVLLLAGCQATQQIDSSSETNDTTGKTPSSDSNSNAVISSDTDTINAAKDGTASSQSDSNKPDITPWNRDDVWERIAMQLKLEVPDHKRVEYYRNWFITHPSHMVEVSRRAEPFLYLIVEKIEERHLPLELALLPVVESSFDAFAYSHGSAAGLWQFVPSTGKMYGLEQNYWYDGRRDVEFATDAALEFLVSLNKRFNGDWNLAIAAYNSGGGRVSRAITKNKKAGKPIDFFSLELPKETSSYVPKLLALADVVANQEKYGISIPPIANKPVLESVDPKEQLDLAIAANYAGLTVTELQSYNPAYNQWATAPEGPFHFLLPLASIDQFTKSVEGNRGKGVKLVRYKVKSGDTLSVIARKHDTTSKIIRTANSLSSNMIRVGQHLMIPTSTKGDDTYALSAKNRLAKTQSTAKGKFKVTHTVASGDSLWTISRKHNVSYQSLAKWNGMGPRDTLKIGQKLVIWKNNSDGAIMRTVHYKVRTGDTISGIASKFKVKSADIVKWNNLAKKKYIKPGQSLKLYVDVTKVSV
ncbi:lytic transglycosylase [Vibrio algarum]|uniref:LysM peptidoglycan-binding domain-containing protein n=1 Tax=Vibrio algarum TaxID=3020714 RepID=A0ABT4YSR4_9VIBR|nr:LysM peptidoglycan-binding domain-containing protein [Vibrio sp. KJ40-1]MDB1124598.1 LysM peptidoglycan-binding domain-containing protein [Vibrio sp. KJ40-1]